MQLKDLVGEHLLSGLDEYIVKGEETWEEDANAYRFVLDDITYMAVEDPSDGYRSMLCDLQITSDKVNYNFPPQKVIGKMMLPNSEYYANDIIEFYDAFTDKLVLSIGTDNYDDYYPSCVMNWHPENLNINQS